jgi:hypothetical protein
MRLYNAGEMGKQSQKNWALIYEKYMSVIDSRKLEGEVKGLNKKLLTENKID